MSALVVVHEPGDEQAGAPWRAAAAEAGWPGPVLAPDLPGHGDEPAPTGGSYEMTDAALFVVRAMAADGLDAGAAVVVGVGAHGWAAEVLALGGRAAGLVLVDGLGGPWRTPAETIAEGARWLRGIADDPAAVGPPPRRGLDPRLRHGIPTIGSRRVAEHAATSLPVPVLVVSTPADPLPAADRDDLAGRFRRGATVVVLPDRSPAAVLAAARGWVGDGALGGVDAQASGA